MINDYTVTLKTENQVFNKSVSLDTYNAISKGMTIQVVINKDNIFLGNKGDDTNVVRVKKTQVFIP